jgi:hypothetical protein
MVLCAVNNGPLSSTMVVIFAVAVAVVYTGSMYALSLQGTSIK